MNDRIEMIEPSEAPKWENLINVNRKHVSRFMKNFIEKMKYFCPELDLSLDENIRFVSEETRKMFAMYQLGWNERTQHEPGAFVLARLTERGMEFAKTPFIMDNQVTATTAYTRMTRRYKGDFFVFTATKGAYEAMQKLTGSRYGRIKAEDEDRYQIPVVISDHKPSTKPLQEDDQP